MSEERKTETDEPPLSPAGEDLLSLEEAVQFLGTSKPTLYRLLAHGDLKGLKVGRRWRFRRSDLQAYMERSPVAVAAAPAGEVDAEMAFFESELRRASLEPPSASDELAEPSARKVDRLIRSFVSLALHAGASDIHLEPARQGGDLFLRLRQRVDGVLWEVRRLPARLADPLLLRLKQMADMDIAERRLPQDGRTPFAFAGKEYDLRIACLPSLLGEAATIRVLDRSSALLGLARLGLLPEALARIQELIRQPNGLLLVSGPVGSGKTTFLYSCLAEVAGESLKTLTIEDPVEYQMPFVTQIQVNRKMGLTFATAARSFLRQDPDVILIGLMRDRETAEIAFESSLTGHLVLSTLHAPGAAETVRRLLELGTAPHLVCATLIGVASLRLVRKVCFQCKQSYEATEADLRRFGFQTEEPDRPVTLWRGTGCETCRRTGYKGRTGLFEVLTVSDEFADAVLRGASVPELTDIAVADGMQTLLMDGMRTALEGITTPEEVMRVTATAAVL